MNPRDFAPATASFRREVLDGLRLSKKELPCKFFYDERGSQLFEEICQLEEYYPTRTELAIMHECAGEMALRIGKACLLIEFGSGSGVKTRLLLDELHDPAAYVPIDISREHLARSAAEIAAAYPDVEVIPVCADYTADYEIPTPRRAAARRVIYFPGSTIGNFHRPRAVEFLAHLRDVCGEDGGLLIGVDLKKNRETLERAYDDAKGVTAAFNRNLLTRINRELGANFDLQRFRHEAVYDEQAGRVEMHLVSLADQTVELGDERFAFEAGEGIRTECSYKYDLDEFRSLADAAGFRVDDVWTDSEARFSVQYLSAH
jgi:dimethylhistidine N-methyltransferase